MKINDILMKQPVLPAPLAGVTDYPFRQILREMGALLVFTEMVSSKGLLYGNKGTKALLDFSDETGDLTAVQLFGEEPKKMARAAVLLEQEYKPDIIDINMGCPAPKIVKNGAGSALLKDEKKAGFLMEKVVQAVNLPVTVKIRSGWDNSTINARRITKIAAETGISLVTIHGRSREQYYSGKADWDVIQRAASAVDIPVAGNGDIDSVRKAEKRLQETDCSAVMIGRGLQGNPWLLKRTLRYLNCNNLIEPPDHRQKITMAISHLKKAVNYYGEQRAVPKMRGHMTWYLKGLPRCCQVKEKINQLKKKKEVISELIRYREELDEGTQ